MKRIHELLPEDVFSGGTTLRYPLELMIGERRLRLFFWVLAAFLILPGLATARLILFEHARFERLAAKNAAQVEPLAAKRGAILDRDGIVLAHDEIYFRVLLPQGVLPEDPSERQIFSQRMARTLGLPGRQAGLTEGELAAVSAQSDLADEREGREVARPQPTSGALVLKDNLSPEEALLFEVRGARELGLRFEERFRRALSHPLAFSHLLGYVGSPSAKDLASNPDTSPSRVGKDGLERAYHELLIGKSGFLGARRDTGEPIRKDPIAGSSLVLTIDAKLQEFLYTRMREHVVSLGIRRASALAQDPRSGAILALINFPSLDAAALNAGLSPERARELIENPDFPFLNRAVSGEYPPGSVIKPLIAAAALEEGVIRPEESILSTGQIEIPNPFRPGEVSIFRDWKAHGWVDMRRALAVSSNAYFYTVGGGYQNRDGLGITRLAKYFRSFGLGERLGIDLPTEASGLVSDPEWKRAHRPADPIWRLGDTYNVSIGQGDFTVTPLQVSSAISAIANNGKLWKPYVVTRIEDAAGNVTSEFPPKLIRELNISQENLAVVREGMRMMVTEGMATTLNDLPVPVAGKTGTPQVTAGETTHAWFSGFAPYDNPEIVLTVIFEGERGGSTRTLPLAKEVFYWYFTQGKGIETQ